MIQIDTLSGKQSQALAALLSAPSVVEAAARARVSPNTLFRWLREDGFQAAYRSARREAMSHAISQLQRAASKAVVALEKVMEADDEPANARVSAASKCLELAMRGLELEDLESRISALEGARPHSNGRAPWT
jgi:hypothetical protein